MSPLYLSQREAVNRNALWLTPFLQAPGLPFAAVLSERDIDEAMAAVQLAVIASHEVGNRPNRVEPRAVKRRPKPHRLLTEPRRQAREKLLAAGRPCGQWRGAN